MSVKILVPELKKTPFFIEPTVRNTQNAIKFMNSSSSFYADAEVEEANAEDTKLTEKEAAKKGNEQVKKFSDFIDEMIGFVETTLKLTDKQKDSLLDLKMEALMDLGVNVATTILNGDSEPDEAGLKK